MRDEEYMKDKLSDLLGVAPRIILAIKRFNGITVTDLQEESKVSSTALYNTLRKLISYGLIIEERESEFPRRRLIKLTDKGRMIAEYLVRIEEALSSR